MLDFFFFLRINKVFVARDRGTYMTAGRHTASGLQSEEERVGVESQRITTRRKQEVDPARLVLTEEQEGGEEEQQRRRRRHAGGSGLHPG